MQAVEIFIKLESADLAYFVGITHFIKATTWTSSIRDTCFLRAVHTANSSTFWTSKNISFHMRISAGRTHCIYCCNNLKVFNQVIFLYLYSCCFKLVVKILPLSYISNLVAKRHFVFTMRTYIIATTIANYFVTTWTSIHSVVFFLIITSWASKKSCTHIFVFL